MELYLPTINHNADIARPVTHAVRKPELETLEVDEQKLRTYARS